MERGKYKNYKKLTSPVDREKYGPKERRYTMGKGQKRIFGETAWSKDGQESICRVREMYDTILEDNKMWGWMHEGWEKYSEKRELFCHYKRKEVADVLGGDWRGWIQGGKNAGLAGEAGEGGGGGSSGGSGRGGGGGDGGIVRR